MTKKKRPQGTKPAVETAPEPSGISGSLSPEPTKTVEADTEEVEREDAETAPVEAEPEQAPQGAASEPEAPTAETNEAPPSATPASPELFPLGTKQHGGIHSARMFRHLPGTEEANFGVDPAGPTARIFRRGKGFRAIAFVGQFPVARVDADSPERAAEALAREVHLAQSVEAERFRAMTQWGQSD